ncbi:hypothetical protein Aazo_5074 ['Nostoc azollae' 0708]|jgi:hypothetical protein|uniref:Uncharacterized protein n=1 Tax=Nostoc azollae (strain 0708) TaxID=551115 RepID=D7DZZ9_NOSA0|nr:hypothetical protein Aazo_5074 ['Nostoc azollae' 0708]
MHEKISSKKIHTSVLGGNLNFIEAIKSTLLDNCLPPTISRAAVVPVATLANNALSLPVSCWY